jgi:hypothetical protein
VFPFTSCNKCAISNLTLSITIELRFATESPYPLRRYNLKAPSANCPARIGKVGRSREKRSETATPPPNLGDGEGDKKQRTDQARPWVEASCAPPRRWGSPVAPRRRRRAGASGTARRRSPRPLPPRRRRRWSPPRPARPPPRRTPEGSGPPGRWTTGMEGRRGRGGGGRGDGGRQAEAGVRAAVEGGGHYRAYGRHREVEDRVDLLNCSERSGL